jgi:dTDP-4-dehydrorhamnose reductase
MTARILVTGVTGQVGFELVRALQGLGDVFAADRHAFDLAKPDQMRSVLRDYRPSIIVNPAAYTAVDNAEQDIEGATQLNAHAPALLAQEAARSGALVVHYSTDYVFDGSKDGAYVESDATCPQNVYGRTKREGELAIAASGCAHLIFRTSWVYGRRGQNFLQTMLRLAAERPELKVVADQIGAPTWSNTLATLTASILARNAGPNALDGWLAKSGIYHLTAGGSTTWAGFAEAIFEEADLEKRPVVYPIDTAAYPTPARRPLNSVMSNAKLEKTFGIQAYDWRHSLRLCLGR